ncbi:thiosulfate dehydrogenase [Dyadobacter jejuensis]|uniref:Thiosulfate dehydrogenase n=1 Tax=Dyadobacter jejuensis TaxID=1082580 RepID=A0A316AJH3_9BACT|nr:c-type cytochrome [Dyadobacter jejuensis]PWJ57913.1 thiosulfate dehydrogenase [Dyadobacter jejuensis]
MKNPIGIIRLMKNTLIGLLVALACTFLLVISLMIFPSLSERTNRATAAVTPLYKPPQAQVAKEPWTAPDTATIPKTEQGDRIRYGRELIVHTSEYLGPNGSVKALSNGMNCQNCHLEAGSKILGNNFAAVYSTYPKFRSRSGLTESVIKRISDCFERSLNGVKPDSSSREMQAMVAYMKWVGQNTPKGVRPEGTGLVKLAYLDRAADPKAGEEIYALKCASCHGANGEGVFNANKTAYQFPPLWGKHSYNDGAGLYKLSSFAGYVVNNMPFGASYKSRMLTEEEAWDLAAYVNAQPRPHKDQTADWVDPSKKPIDFPFAPYTDSFTEQQHKFGPFAEIAKVHGK